MIGGMMTPAGSSINLLVLDLLYQATGISVSFVQWMAIGIPLCVLLLPAAWFVFVRVYRPVEMQSGAVRRFIDGLDVPKTIGANEIKVLAITGTMLLLWIASSWVPYLNVMVIAVLGCCAMFLPGIRVLEWKTFVSRQVSWDSFFLMGTVLSISAAMVANGVSDWLMALMPTGLVANPILLVGLTALIVFVALLIIPVAPALVVIMVMPLVALGADYSPTVLVLTLGLCAANCYLLPLDTVTLITYGSGYYSMTDMMRATGVLQLLAIVIIALWLPFICGALGLA
jgi:sodium-dependent dicarboxylate transporter 2/3/5